MAGTITTSTIQNDTSSPPTFRNNSREIGTLCRAWVNFNGEGTVAIRASFNVSSITDISGGVYTINLTNAMPDANYSVNVSAGQGIDSVRYVGSSARAVPTTTTFQIQIVNSGGGDSDPAYCYAAVFR